MLSMLKRSSRSPATNRLIFSVGAKLSPAFLPDDKKPRSRRHISGAAEPVISLIPLSGLLIMFRISLISNRLYELGDVHGRIDQVAHHTDHFDTDEIARESKGDESAERRVLDTYGRPIYRPQEEQRQRVSMMGMKLVRCTESYVTTKFKDVFLDRIRDLPENLTSEQHHEMLFKGLETERLMWFFAKRRLGGGEWKFQVVDEPIKPATVDHEREVIITTGKLAEFSNDDELAFVLAHEVAHYLQDDHRKKMEYESSLRVNFELPLLAYYLLYSIEGGETGTACFLLFALGAVVKYHCLKWSRIQELRADRMALLIAELAGYDANRGREAVLKFKSIWWLPDFLLTHPGKSTRNRNVLNIRPKETIGSILKSCNTKC